MFEGFTNNLRSFIYTEKIFWEKSFNEFLN